jgi:hypothetical protein
MIQPKESLEQKFCNLEVEIENMELRILESVWSLERGVLDQMDMLKALRSELRHLRAQIDPRHLQSFHHPSVAKEK